MEDILQHGHLLTKGELAAAAREARISSELSQTEAARQLGVSQPTIAQAETAPKRELSALRVKMIERFGGGVEVAGPFYCLKWKGSKLKGGDFFR